MSSEVNILFGDLFNPQATSSQHELEEQDFFTQLVDQIVDNALAIAKDHDYIAHSVLADIISDVSFSEDVSVSLSPSVTAPSSESEGSSNSSYQVPSYLEEDQSQPEFPDEISPEIDREHVCEQYEGIDKYASLVVEKIINKALAAASIHIVQGDIEQWAESSKLEDEEVVVVEDEEEEEAEGYSTASSIVEWPSIEAFNTEYGLTKIYEFMDTWDYDEDWLYCVDYITSQSDECSDYYIYEAMWSIPTQMYPIPQATASIYFKIERSRVKPRNCPVNVTYVYEGTSFVHTLESAFSEDRLFEIIDAKLKFYQRLTF